MGSSVAGSGSQRLGTKVREQRKALRLTQHALAEHAGVGLVFLYQLESGKPTVRLDKVLAVCAVLGLVLEARVRKPGEAPGSVVGS